MFYSTFLKWNLISLKAHKLMPMTSYASLGYDDVIVYFKLAMSKWRFFAQEFHQLAQEYINANDVITFFFFTSWMKYAGIS